MALLEKACQLRAGFEFSKPPATPRSPSQHPLGDSRDEFSAAAPASGPVCCHGFSSTMGMKKFNPLEP